MCGIVFCLGSPVALWEAYRFLPRTSGAVPTLSYAEVTTIVLAALTIVLGFLGLFVGGLAIWGYQSIKSEGIAAAEKSAEKATEEALSAAIARQFSEEAVKKLIAVQTKHVIRKEALLLSRRYSEAFAADRDDLSGGQPDSTTRHVGKEYPKEETLDEG